MSDFLLSISDLLIQLYIIISIFNQGWKHKLWRRSKSSDNSRFQHFKMTWYEQHSILGSSSESLSSGLVATAEANLSSSPDSTGGETQRSSSPFYTGISSASTTSSASSPPLFSSSTRRGVTSSTENAEDAKLQAEAAIAEATETKETAEAVLGALADIEDVLQSLLLRKRRQDGSTGVPLEATSTLGGITAPTSCAAFTEMVNQVIAMSTLVKDLVFRMIGMLYIKPRWPQLSLRAAKTMIHQRRWHWLRSSLCLCVFSTLFWENDHNNDSFLYLVA